MKALFGSKKSPAELSASLTKHIKLALENKSKPEEQKKSLEKVSSHLNSVKVTLYGDMENEAKPQVVAQMTELVFSSDLLLQLIENMKIFEFEARKDCSQVANFVLRQAKTQSVEYIKAHPDILKMLVNGYSDTDVALNCGSILREVIRHEALNDMLLNSPLFDAFFEYVQVATFDVASDAFATFKLMLTKHKSCSKFLETNFDKVFAKYNELLQSRNYVTKRQSLKLLGELLLNRSNFAVMMKYINDPNNLKLTMNLLRGNTKAIQFEAFHVFKIMAANPKKSKPVAEILIRNRAKLKEFLSNFQKEKEDDQFNDEKSILIASLDKLDASILDAPAGGAGAAGAGEKKTEAAKS